MKVPKCPICKKIDMVVIAHYPKVKPYEWRGYECERCWTVVKELKG